MRAISWKAISRAALISAAMLGSAVALSACHDYYDGYGYTSLSVTAGSPGYGYRRPYYGTPYWGWRGNYYYPGVYVYDHDRRPHRWNNDQRQYWEGRWSGWGGGQHDRRNNWDDFDGRGRGHH